MTDLTDRYLGAALGGVPSGKRSDVERELRSSIADAIDDRTAAGEDPPRPRSRSLRALAIRGSSHRDLPVECPGSWAPTSTRYGDA